MCFFRVLCAFLGNGSVFIIGITVFLISFCGLFLATGVYLLWANFPDFRVSNKKYARAAEKYSPMSEKYPAIRRNYSPTPKNTHPRLKILTAATTHICT